MSDAHDFPTNIQRRQLLAAMAGAGLAGMAPLGQAEAAW